MRAGVIRLLVPLAVLLAVLLSAAILAVWKRTLAVDAWLSGYRSGGPDYTEPGWTARRDV